MFNLSNKNNIVLLWSFSYFIDNGGKSREKMHRQVIKILMHQGKDLPSSDDESRTMQKFSTNGANMNFSGV